MLLETPIPGLKPMLLLGALLLDPAALAQNPPSVTRQEAQTEDQIYRQLLGQNPNAPTAAPAAPSSPGRQRREAQAEDQIYQQLLGQNPNAPGAATPPPPSGTPGQDARATDQIFRELMNPSPAPSR